MERCVFCKGLKPATGINKDKIPVCESHRVHEEQLTCPFCGLNVFPERGRYGTYFVCLKHGNISLKKMLELIR